MLFQVALASALHVNRGEDIKQVAVQVIAVIIDARPTYISSECESLLCMPWNQGTLLESVAQQLRFHGLSRFLVVPPDGETPRYPHHEGTVVSWGDLRKHLWLNEPSDWMLFIDAAVQPTGALDLFALLADLESQPHWTRHLVAMEQHAGGTRECVETDPDGQVRRIQRYYDNVTWSFAAGLLASVVPVATLRMATRGFTSLPELRTSLAASHVPTRDLVFSGSVVRLEYEAQYLHTLQQFARDGANVTESVRPSWAAIDSSARIIGPVMVQDGVTVGPRCTIVGPTVLGSGSTIEEGSIVAQSVVGPGALIPPRATVRHRVVVSGTPIDKLTSGSDVAAAVPIPFKLPSADTATATPGSARWYPPIKLVIEAILAAAALLVLSPLLLVIAILVKLESRGPLFYGDRREARNGKPFRCYKFRTMFVGADQKQRELMNANQVDGPQFKMERDPRVTRVGRVLRATSLDELPQLFNVVLGQMSIVGPRPSPFRENQVCVPWREGRLSVRPGITGLWQVCRHDRSSGDFHQWIYYDLLYVRHMSPLIDLKIVLATIYTLGGKGSVPLEWIVPAKNLEAAA